MIHEFKKKKVDINIKLFVQDHKRIISLNQCVLDYIRPDSSLKEPCLYCTWRKAYVDFICV